MVAHQAVTEDAHPRTLPSFFQNLDERGEIPAFPKMFIRQLPRLSTWKT
jgi:hypothetical protein